MEYNSGSNRESYFKSRDRAPMTCQIGAPRTNHDREFCYNKTTTNLLKIVKRNDQLHYFNPQIAYKLIEAGRSEDILQVQGLSINALNNSEDTTKQKLK